MTTNQAIQIQSGAVHHATLPTPYRLIDYQILWSTHHADKAMRDWAGERAKELKYGEDYVTP